MVTPLPVHHVGAGVGDEHAPAVEVGAIEDDLVVDHPGRLRARDRYSPAPGGGSPEGAGATAEIAALRSVHKPGVKPVQLGSSGELFAVDGG